jgi:hypothetical protein
MARLEFTFCVELAKDGTTFVAFSPPPIHASARAASVSPVLGGEDVDEMGNHRPAGQWPPPQPYLSTMSIWWTLVFSLAINWRNPNFGPDNDVRACVCACVRACVIFSKFNRPYWIHLHHHMGFGKVTLCSRSYSSMVGGLYTFLSKAIDANLLSPIKVCLSCTWRFSFTFCQ